MTLSSPCRTIYLYIYIIDVYKHKFRIYLNIYRLCHFDINSHIIIVVLYKNIFYVMVLCEECPRQCVHNIPYIQTYPYVPCKKISIVSKFKIVRSFYTMLYWFKNKNILTVSEAFRGSYINDWWTHKSVFPFKHSNCKRGSTLQNIHFFFQSLKPSYLYIIISVWIW